MTTFIQGLNTTVLLIFFRCYRANPIRYKDKELLKQMDGKKLTSFLYCKHQNDQCQLIFIRVFLAKQRRFQDTSSLASAQIQVFCIILIMLSQCTNNEFALSLILHRI